MAGSTQLVGVVALALGIAGPVCAADSPEELAASLKQAFHQRDIDLYASLLADRFSLYSSCFIHETRERELQVMSDVFARPATIDLLTTSNEVFRRDEDEYRLIFEFSAGYRERDLVVGQVESSNHLILRRAADTGEWFIRSWIETYIGDRPECGTGSPTNWTDSRSFWLGQSPTGIYSLSYGQVKAQTVSGTDDHAEPLPTGR